MTNLLRAELTRYLSRKIVWIGFGLALLALAGIVVIMSFQTAAPSAAERAEAERFYQQNHQEWEQGHEAAEAQCREQGVPAEQCWPEPQLSDFLGQVPFDVAASDVAATGLVFLGLAVMVITASLIGADFSSGSMSHWLSFAPRRSLVYSSKLAVAVVVSTLIGAVVLALALLALTLVVTLQDQPLTGAGDTWAYAGRATFVLAVVAIIGTTLGFLTRRTIAAVGMSLGYLFVRFVLSGIFMASEWWGRSTPVWPEMNILAVLEADYRYQVYAAEVSEQGMSYTATEHVLPWEQGLVYVLALVLALVLAGLLTFRRRDVP